MATQQELELVGWVAELVERQYGVVAGQPTKRDGNDVSGLTVDFTFDNAGPRLAVEVTRLRADFENPPAGEQRRLEDRLRRFANKKGWAHWTVGLRPETKFKSSLGPAVERMVEWMLAAKLDTLGPGTYTADVPLDLLQRMGNRFMQDCERARLEGVILVRRELANGIRVLPVTEFSDSKSLLRPLARAFVEKSPSMGKAKAQGYVTMLAIDVEREDASGYLSENVKVPVFPREIDHLWLFVRESPGGGVEKAFHAKRNDRRLKGFELEKPGKG